jgi:uncharacterized membrane protein
MYARYNSNQTDTSFGAYILVACTVLACIALIALIVFVFMIPKV